LGRAPSRKWQNGGETGNYARYFVALERFQAKWTPVRVKKTRQIKNLEPASIPSKRKKL
jgi:hypothetical protein